MARDLFCERLVLASIGGVREVDLAYPVVCVFGPIDTGKTTLVDCIQYALGLPVAWREVPEKRLQTVTLFVRIEGMRIGLRRSLVGETKSVELLDGSSGQVEETLDVEAREGSDRRTVGEVLLDMLGLAEMFAPPSAVALLGAGARLTFEQLYAMCYLTQDLVDGSESVRGKANTAQSYRTIVELLLGLTDGPMRVLTARKDELTRTLGELRRRAGTIGGFLTGSAADLETELARSQGEEQDGLRSLEEFKGRMRAATAHADPFRRRVQELEQVLEQSRRAAGDAEYALVRERRQVQRLAEQRHHGPQPVSPCPACTADLSGRPVPDGGCPLCLSELDPEALARALQAAQASLAAAERHSVERGKALGEAQTAWEQARAELDERTREDISPLAAQIEQLAAAHATARTRTTMLERELDPHRRLAELHRAVQAAEEELKGVREDIRTRKNLLAGRKITLGEFEEHFTGLIDAVGLPGDPGARINHSSLLPQVRTGNLTKVGHGVRSAINVVYRMTFLSYALVTGATDLPSLLIVDSPRKNVGYGQDDQELIGRLYAHFLDHIAGVRSGATRTRPHQVIIVDNDLPRLPKRLLDQMHTIELTREDLLVP
ncbi:ATP-binding protein [Streptomyces sp. NPDC056202]|uniref:ATP-binding protein n=1 Tax=Streptomyces sp. NPDC056202 TaxID=3345745 RepID=UPI0035D8BE15